MEEVTKFSGQLFSFILKKPTQKAALYVCSSVYVIWLRLGREVDVCWANKLQSCNFPVKV